MTIIRIVFAMLFLGSASFGGVYLFAEDATEALQAATFPGSRAQGLLGGGYNLADLELLESTLYYVEEAYVEPQRIQPDKMYRAALQSIERRVPTCMFRREEGASMLHVQIGTFQTVTEVPEITSSAILRQELKKIASMVREHVSETDINARDDSSDPFAQIEYSMINGILGTLDPHSILLPPVDSRQMDEDNKGEFGGLGITIVSREGRLTVEYPLKDTPAEREGLQADDHIVRIDGETTINMSLEEAVRKLRGPVGAPVVIHIMRQGLTEPLRVPIVRARIKLNPVESQLLDGGVGWISIKSFHANVEADLGEQLSYLRREAGGRLNGLVLDLRGNPGGYLNQAIAVSNRFLSDGVIVSTVDGQGREGTREVARSRNTEENYPIAVLLDSSSASASEIVAGALRNNERAIVIGERSFGKGSVQNLTPFFDQSKLKLTISKYLTPGGRSIQSIGIPADIEMLPVIIEGRSPEDEVGTDLALVYWRERVRREGDLDKHLDRAHIREEKPAYSFSYLRPKDMRRKSAEIDLSKDEQIQFARDVLLSSSSYKRPEMLAGAHRVVKKYSQQSQAKIKAAFDTLGIDWSEGPSQEEATLDVSVTYGGDGEMQAGSYEVVRVTVTNRGEKTLYQLGALTTSENQILDDGEFFFGKLAPGETRYFERRVWVLTGYPSEEAPVDIQFRDVDNPSLFSQRVKVPVKGTLLPKFSWKVDFDDVTHGNGDGILQVDERVLVNLSVTNVGEGPSAESFARIKNKSGSALDIVRGTVEPGFMVTPEGSRCEPTLPGIENGVAVGPVDEHPERIANNDPPTYAPECKRVLSVGEQWSGSFELAARKDIDEALVFELSIGDAEAYDHASVMRQGFYGYFSDLQELSFKVGDSFPTHPVVVPPTVTVSQHPDAVVNTRDAIVSGVVRDDNGIAHIMVFHGEDKVFFDGSDSESTLRSVPFSADLQLKEGLNAVTVLTTDTSGATATKSVIVYRNSADEIKDNASPKQSD